MQIPVIQKATFPLGFTVSSTINVLKESYEYSTFDIPPGAVDLELDIAPILTKEDLGLLVIVANLYPNGLSYKIHASSEPVISFENPHIINSSDQMNSLMGIPDKLFFSNPGVTNVVLTVVIARNVASSLSSMSSRSSRSSMSSRSSRLSISSQSSYLSVSSYSSLSSVSDSLSVSSSSNSSRSSVSSISI